MNGKAKEHFNDWLIKKYDCKPIDESINGTVLISEVFYNRNFPKSCQSALIIEWFDYLGFNIITPKWVNDFYFKIDFSSSKSYESEFCYESRQEATDKAIEYLISYYNQK